MAPTGISHLALDRNWQFHNEIVMVSKQQDTHTIYTWSKNAGYIGTFMTDRFRQMCCMTPLILTCSLNQNWKYLWRWHKLHLMVLFRHWRLCNAPGCFWLILFIYCSGAQWAQSTVKTYWSQSECEGVHVASLQQMSRFTKHCAANEGALPIQCTDKKKGISENVFAFGIQYNSSVSLWGVCHISAHLFQSGKVCKWKFSCAQ